MALLAALCACKCGAVMHNDIRCLHVEHGLRPAQESKGDAEFVRDFCKSNKIECHVEHIKPGKIAALAQRKGIGIEAAARYFRHKALSREAARLGKNTIILLAHTKDDLLETALMRVLRGVGPAGLAAMPVRRGRIFRPLLNMSRADITGYLTDRNIHWREDSTNTDEMFLRNKIRCRLIPLLNESFPSWKSGVTSLAQTQSLAAGFIAQETKDRICWEKTSRGVRTKGSAGEQRTQGKSLIFTDEMIFFSQPLIIREEAIFLGINTLSCLCDLRSSALSREKIQIKSIKRSVVRKFCSGSVNAADLGPVRVKREKGEVLLSCKRKEYFESGVSMLIK